MNPLDVLDRPTNRGFLTKLLIACCGGPFLDGYVMSIIGVALIGLALWRIGWPVLVTGWAT